MNVKEMIEWLQTQPQDAVVEVVNATRYDDYNCSMSTVEFTTNWQSLYDWTGNKYIKPGNHQFNKKVLTLGSCE